MLPHGPTVTVDTNALDKAGRPERHPSDPARADFAKVHEALKRGDLRGFVCDTVVTLEGIQRADRAKVFGSTSLARSHEETRTGDGATIVHHVTLQTTQPARSALHPENARRFQAALSLGFRAICVPRIGLP